MIEALGWVLLYVKDLDAMSAFYRDQVGLEVAYECPGVTAFDTGPCMFELFERADLDNPRSGWDRNVVLISFRVADIEAAVETLRERGVDQASEIKFVIGVENPRWRLAQFRDPEGNLFEVIDEPLGWHPDD
jgi:catechol 2,3-dioxygenase-like lactoylglutathione lyase family enzyme